MNKKLTVSALTPPRPALLFAGQALSPALP